MCFLRRRWDLSLAGSSPSSIDAGSIGQLAVSETGAPEPLETCRQQYKDRAAGLPDRTYEQTVARAGLYCEQALAGCLAAVQQRCPVLEVSRVSALRFQLHALRWPN